MTAVELARELKPDVLVTDLMIPRLHGLEVIKQVHRELKKTNILMLSTYSDEPLVKEALHNGARPRLIAPTLAFNSQTDLVRFAIRKGLISP